MHKLLKISRYYSQFINLFYYKNPDIKALNFEAHRQRLFMERFEWSDAWKYYLEETGNWNVEEIVVNDELLQLKWVKERNLKVRRHSVQVRVTALQIADFKPDVIFLKDIGPQWEIILNLAVRLWPQVKWKPVLIFDGIGRHNFGENLRADIVLSCLPETVSFYERKKNLAGYYFMHGFDSRVWNDVPKREVKDQEFLGFIGQVSFFGGHRYRAQIIESIFRDFEICLNLGNRTSFRLLLAKVRRHGFHGFREILQYYRRQCALERKSQRPVYGLLMYQAIASSSVQLNVHIDAAQKTAANLRLFEVTGMGTCLLTDHKENLPEFFKPDVEVVTFRGIEDALEKIRFLKDNPAAIATIAERGMKRCWGNHLLGERIRDFEKYLRNRF